jgi:hypothetical protein
LDSGIFFPASLSSLEAFIRKTGFSFCLLEIIFRKVVAMLTISEFSSKIYFIKPDRDLNEKELLGKRKGEEANWWWEVCSQVGGS